MAPEVETAGSSRYDKDNPRRWFPLCLCARRLKQAGPAPRRYNTDFEASTVRTPSASPNNHR